MLIGDGGSSVKVVSDNKDGRQAGWQAGWQGDRQAGRVLGRVRGQLGGVHVLVWVITQPAARTDTP